MSNALEIAVKEVGGQNALAAQLGVRQSTVWYWLTRSKRGVPGEHVAAIESATNGKVTKHDLRPDLFPSVSP